MTKTLQIAGQTVTVSTSGLAAFIYKREFKRDFLKDMMTMRATEEGSDGSEIDAVIFMQIFWVLAKCANRDLPAFEEFYESLEYFPVADVIKEVFPLVMTSLTTSVQPKKSAPRKRSR